MKAKDYVLSHYPKAYCFRWIYNNTLRRPEYIIMEEGRTEWLFRDPKGSKWESSAWVYAKKQIIENEKTASR